MMSSGESIKAQVVDKIPKRFKELKFGIQSNQDIVNQGVIEVSNKMLYNVENGGRTPIPHGPLDPRLVREAYLDLQILSSNKLY